MKKLMVAMALSLAAGFLLGAASIRRPILNAPLELPPTRTPWSLKDVLGLIGSVGIRTLAGHLVYIDHDIDLKVQSTGMTNFVPGCTSRIDGTATANSAPVTFNVTVMDHGEPGTSDTFSIVIPELGYSQSGTLGGGNIKVHRLHCQ